MDGNQVLGVIDAKIAELNAWGAMHGPGSTSHDAAKQLTQARIAVATAYDRLATLDREVKELRADALRLIEAAQPFAMFNSSEPTITVRTPDVARLRAMLHAMRVRLTGTSER